MGRSGSILLEFLMNALDSKKYNNLKYINEGNSVFSLWLPRKTRKLDPKHEQILKDWRSLKGQSYEYTKAKQAVESALKKSVFLARIPSKGKSLIYRKLDDNEVKEKKRVCKEMVRRKKESSNPPSVDSSGYGSGGDSPANQSVEEANRVIKDEHAYSLLTKIFRSESTSDEEVVVFLPMQGIAIIENEVGAFVEHDSLNVKDVMPSAIQNITDGEIGAIAVEESNSNDFNGLLCVNPNEILNDCRSTQSFVTHFQTLDEEAMETAGNEEAIEIATVLEAIETGTIVEAVETAGVVEAVETASVVEAMETDSTVEARDRELNGNSAVLGNDSTLLDITDNYLGPFDFQDGFDGFPLETDSQSAAWNELEEIGYALLQSADSTIKILGGEESTRIQSEVIEVDPATDEI